MIGISQYRHRIGTFSQKVRNKKSFMNSFDRIPEDKSRRKFLTCLQAIIKIILLLSFLPCWYSDVNFDHLTAVHCQDQVGGGHAGYHQGLGGARNYSYWGLVYSEIGKKSTSNCLARYTYMGINRIKEELRIFT